MRELVITTMQGELVTFMDRQHNHSRDFHIMLGIMNYINQEKGYLENLEQLLGFDQQTLKLWLQSMVAMGYLKKDANGEYHLSEKGKQELQFHTKC